MLALFRAAYAWFIEHYEQVNRLNVFPVPDGDTGTNMLMTLRSARAKLDQLQQPTVSEVIKAASQGAHGGSRGNSGVILGRILHGMSEALSEKAELTSNDLGLALARARKTAYESVISPVEGTILTVARAIEEAATTAASNDLRAIFSQIVTAADDAVRRTPELLPMLKKAGVVDSGAKGLFLIFEGMHRALMGWDVNLNGEKSAAIQEAETAPAAIPNKGQRLLPPVRWGFDIQCLVEQPNQPLEAVRQEIQAMGECALVEGDERLMKIHVHVMDPGIPLSYAVKLGFVTDIVVENMDDMAQAHHVAEIAEPAPKAMPGSGLPAVPTSDEIGLVAVAQGDGFADIFRSLGVEGIVLGGQTMNPSTAELMAAAQRLSNRRVIILPNNRNIWLAAQQTIAALGSAPHAIDARMLTTKNAVQAIASLLIFDPTAPDLDALCGQMQDHLEATQCAEITQAVRDAEIDTLSVHTGEFIAFVNGNLCICADQLNQTVLQTVERLCESGGSLLTLYYASFIAKEAAENLIRIISDQYPSLDVELAYGGQPHYHYILSLE